MMKKLVALLWTLMIAVSIQAETRLYFDEFKIMQGETKTLDLNLENSALITGMEFVLTLPEGLSFVEDPDEEEYVIGTGRCSFLGSSIKANGSLGVAGIASKKKDYIPVGDGAILTVTIKASDNVALGSGKIKISGIEIGYKNDASDASSQIINPSDLEFTATVYQEVTVSATSSNETAGSVAGGGNYAVGAQATLTATPKTGYKFVNWTSGDDVVSTTNPYVFTVSAAASLVAHFEAVSYTLSYDLDGGTLGEATNPASYTVETADITLNNPTKEGYTFAGWKEGEAEAIAEVTIAKGSTGDHSYTATWTINQYTITFDSNGGSAVAAITQDYGTAVTAPVAPTREGYTFNGWDKKVPTTMPAENVTLTAQWTINQYTITFDSDGGTSVADIVDNYGATLTAPAAPTKTGYTFKGWTPAFPETMPLNGASLKATWEAVTYNISYNLDGGTLAQGDTNPATYTVESEAITLKNPTKEGYTFKGWTGTDLTEATTPVTIAAGSTGDCSYTATWTVNQYTMTFVLGNGEDNVVKTQDFGSALTAPTPTREGYTFSGWDIEVPATVPASDKTFTAQWTLNTSIAQLFVNSKTVDVYTINGTLVGRKITADEVLQLPKGLYIINGKKMVVK